MPDAYAIRSTAYSSTEIRMEIGDRLRKALEEKGWSIKKLSEICDIPYRTTQDYLHGKTSPGADALKKLCGGLEVSADYLLFGLEADEEEDLRSMDEILNDMAAGRPLSEKHASMMEGAAKRGRAMRELGELPAVQAAEPHTPLSKLGLSISAVADMENSEGGRIARELGLGGRALMARRGSQGREWRILTELVEALPGGRTPEQLCAALQDTAPDLAVTDLAPELHSLEIGGLIRQQSLSAGVQYHAASSWAQLRAHSWSDKAQHGVEAVRLLMRRIAPVAEGVPSDGSLATATVMVSRDRAEACLRAIRDAVRDVLQEEGVDEEGEELTVVLGVALTRSLKKGADGVD